MSNDPYYLSDDEFNQHFDHCLSLAEKVIAEGKCKAFTPALTIFGVDKEEAHRVVHALLADFDMEYRFELMEDLGEKFGREGLLARCIFFATEAWFSAQQLRPGERALNPSDDANRIEVIQCSGMAFDGRVCLGRMEVTRTKKNVMQLVAGGKEVFRFGQGQMTNNIARAFYRGQAKVLLAERGIRL